MSANGRESVGSDCRLSVGGEGGRNPGGNGDGSVNLTIGGSIDNDGRGDGGGGGGGSSGVDGDRNESSGWFFRVIAVRVDLFCLRVSFDLPTNWK